MSVCVQWGVSQGLKVTGPGGLEQQLASHLYVAVVLRSSPGTSPPPPCDTYAPPPKKTYHICAPRVVVLQVRCGNQFELLGRQIYLAVSNRCPVDLDGKSRPLDPTGVCWPAQVLRHQTGWGVCVCGGGGYVLLELACG
jgi:hypothetical protein